MKRITIKDIAQALNMHHSTVSRSLRNDSNINEKTRKRVLKYADEHGYQINRSALQLRGDKSNVIGVVVPNVNHNFFSNIVSQIANLAFEKGYVVSVFQSNESLQQEKEIIKALIQNNVAGVVASVSMETRTSEHLKRLNDFQIPLVMFDRVTNDIEVTKVLAKTDEIVKETIDILVTRGYKRIAYLTGISEMNVFYNRQVGYRRGICENNLDYEQCVTMSGQFTVEKAKNAVRKLFDANQKPDAFICDSHFFLFGVIAELKDLNLDFNEFGMASFGVLYETGIVFPKLISIIQPVEEMAKAAFESLFKILTSESSPEIKNIRFNASLIEN